MGDVGVNDLLLHHCDSSFTIPETVDFLGPGRPPRGG
jgi:hypothetical protein